MSFAREIFSLKAAALFFAGLLTVPMAAQQEVTPEHFDQQPSTAQSHRPSPRAQKAASTKGKQSVSNQASSAPKAKKKIQSSTAPGGAATTASIAR